MLNKDLHKYLNKEFPEMGSITEETRNENAKRIFTGGVRINNSMYRTQKEDEAYRKSILATKLP